MIEQLSLNHDAIHTGGDAILAVRLGGRFGPEDHRRLLPALQAQIERYGGIRAVFDLRGIERIGMRALFDEMRIAKQCSTDLIRCAVIADRSWLRLIARLFGHRVRRGRVRVFHGSEIQSAWDFAGGDASNTDDDSFARRDADMSRPASAASAPRRADFESPHELVERDDLSPESRLRMLESWERDEVALQVADDEGMVGPQRPRVAEVEDAIRELRRRQPILVATDLSRDFAALNSVVFELSRRLSSDVRLTHCVPPDDTPAAATAVATMALPALSVPDDSVRMEHAEEEMRILLKRLRAGSPEHNVTGEVHQGAPEVEIPRLAQECHARLLVVPSHAHGRWHWWWVGSVSDAVRKGSSVPTLLVSAEEPRPLPERPHLMIVVDPSEASRSRLPIAVDIARDLTARVTLLHAESEENVAPVVDPSPALRVGEDDRRTAHDIEESLEAVRAQLDDPGVTLDHVTGPSVVEAIVRHADEANADWVCLLNRIGGLDRLIAGSPSSRLMRDAHAAVLLFP